VAPTSTLSVDRRSKGKQSMIGSLVDDLAQDWAARSVG
jgi:hypothetical protein